MHPALGEVESQGLKEQVHRAPKKKKKRALDAETRHVSDRSLFDRYDMRLDLLQVYHVKQLTLPLIGSDGDGSTE